MENRWIEIESVGKEKGWYKFKFVKNGEKLEELQENYDDDILNAYNRYN